MTSSSSNARKKYGHYIVGLGGQFKMKPINSHYGYERCLIMDRWYVVHVNGMIMGSYFNEELATNLAAGLYLMDQKKLAAEIEKVLTDEATET